jgi:serine/threonine-protein kinase
VQKLTLLFIVFGATLSSLNFAIAPSGNSDLTGVISNPCGDPFSSVWVIVTEGGQEKARSLTGDDGKYFIGDLENGEYDLVVKVEQCEFRKRLRFTGSMVYDVSLSLRQAPRDYLAGEEVKLMLRSYDYYAGDGGRAWDNPEGQGLCNAFESQEGDNAIVDQSTCLIWQRGGSMKPMTFSEATRYIQQLNANHHAGSDGWRLPTLEEAMSLMEPKKQNGLFIDPNFQGQQRWIWTADKASDRVSLWTVDFSSGTCYAYPAETQATLPFVRAVCSGI